MKRITIIPLALAALLTLSCQKNVQNTDPASGEIILTVNADELGTDVDTKTTAVNSLPASLYWGATTGSGSESAKWASASGTVSAGKISTGKYQTATPTTYNYYVSNVSMSVGANTSVSATGGMSGTDVICGRAASSSATPSVTLNHVFARTGSITTTCANGSLTSLSYTIKAKGANTGTSGTYNLRTGAWSSTSGLSSDTAITGSSDMYVIPGSYTIAVTATYTRGNYVVTKTMSGDVTLTGGKINNISLTWPDGGTEIKVTVTLTAWSSQNVASSLRYNCPAVDLGNHSGGTAVLYAAWNVGASSETDYGDYYAWGETNKRYTSIAGSTITGATFEWSNAPYHTGSDENTGWTKYIPSSETSYWSGSGSPDNKQTLDLMDDAARVQWGGDWRTPTIDELMWLYDNCGWDWYDDYNGSGVSGYLVTGTGSYSSASVFLPAAGYCTGSTRDGAGTGCFYWSSSVDSHDFPPYAWSLSFDYGMYEDYRYVGYSVRPVRSVSL